MTDEKNEVNIEDDFEIDLEDQIERIEKSKKRKSSRRLKGGDGYRVDVSRSVGGLPIYERYDGCKASTKNNLDMSN